ncbi:MAG: DUF1365 domain-containing protein [Aquabacterium sp.]|nr:MAG: DUF1365 domain-containing protein [Aquabacterium sp.]
MKAAAEIVRGWVRHERLRPLRHRFAYPVFWLRMDLGRLDELQALSGGWFGVDRSRPLSLRRRDHGPRDGSDLLPWARKLLRDAGVAADGAVHLQCFPRVLGFGFNPVSFWYCHDAGGELAAVLAEVNNTFGEHHLYLLSAPDGRPLSSGTLSCRKVLHVSPFCTREGSYRFRFRQGDASRFVGVDYLDAEGLLLATAMAGTARPFDAAGLRGELLRQPLLALGVVARIHWQALLLWLRGLRVHRKPAPPAATLTAGSTFQETHR